MAVKRPLALYVGEIRELVAGDTLPDTLSPGSEGIYRNGSSGPQTLNTAVDQILTGTSLVVPAGLLLAGSSFIGTLFYSTTTGGTGTITVRLRGGTAGTTADTALMTYALGASTNATVSGRLDIVVHVRTIGASATTYGSMQHSKSGTNGPGGSGQFGTIVGTSAAFNSTTATTFHLDWQCTATTPSLVMQTASLEIQI
jgi:hypothetical protein